MTEYKGVGEGNRNNQLFRYACSLVKKGYVLEHLEQEVRTANEQNKPPLPEREIINILQSCTKKKYQDTDYKPQTVNNKINTWVTLQNVIPIQKYEEWEKGQELTFLKEDYDNFPPEIKKIFSPVRENQPVMHSLKQLVDEGVPPVEERVEKIVPKNGITMIGGAGASFKTYFALTMGLCVGSGQSFLDTFKTEQCNVLICDLENGKATMVRRTNQISKGNNLEIKDVYL